MAGRDLPTAPAVAPGSPAAQVGRLGRLILKELREVLRDRRTILTLVLMPVLVYPLLSVAFQQFFLASAKTNQPPDYLVAFANEEEAGLVVDYWQITAARVPRPPILPSPGVPDPPAEDRLPVRVGVREDMEEAVLQGRFDLGIRLRDPARWQEAQRSGYRPDQNLRLECELVYVQGSPQAEAAREYVERLFAAANARFLQARLNVLGVQGQRADPVRVAYEPRRDPFAGSTFSLTTFIPLILILMTITGAVYPAIDLTAGERERGTLEVLIAAPIPRLGVLFAKYVAVVTVAVLTAVANLTMMAVTLSVSGLTPVIFGPAGLTVGLVVEVFGLLLLFAAFFSAVLLAVTSFARSFKEAQAYLIPLMLLALAPGILSLVPGVKLSGLLTVTPLVNMVLLARDLFEGQAQAGLAAVVVLSTLLYALAALAAAARLFGAEAVLYSDQSGWSDLLRRPAEPRPAPTVVSALFCMALLFPASFLATSLIGRWEGVPLDARLGLLAAVTALLFGGIPLAAAALGRVRLTSGFLVRGSSPGAFAGALLLGLSLWPLAHEVLLLMKDWGLTALRSEQEEHFRALGRQLKDLSPALVVLGLGVVPAVVEEWFFRGYLFSALRAVASARTTLVASALLFGLFHLVTTDALAVERFVTSTLLGLVLGWVCWRSGSVLPGMLLHACHNGAVALLACYEEELRQSGWDPNTHVPVAWLSAAVLGAVAGAALLRLRAPAETNEAAR
jgi:sodium transport system permease protein